MGTKSSFILIFVLLAFWGKAQKLQKIENFGKNDGNLNMYVYAPQKLKDSCDVVFVLHGCTQNAKMIASETGWNKIADSLGLLIVYPEQKLENNLSKCFNFFLKKDVTPENGEMSSIIDMVNYVKKQYKTAKLFITGMSAGGGMTNQLLSAYPNVFDAAAILAGPVYFTNRLEENSTDDLPKIAYLHGKNDLVVLHSQSEQSINYWLKIYKNKPQADTINNYLNRPDFTLIEYKNDAQKPVLVLLSIDDFGHKIAINSKDGISKNDFHTKDIRFNSTLWIADFFGLINFTNP
ncbi:MAG: PHB depolymerase family esterase [Vicingaceae bacterium]